MTALMMRAKLAKLRAHHGVTLAPVTIPLTAPTSRAQVISGYAATLDLDLVRNRFRGWAFGAVHRYAPPPLFYKHDQSREVGTITSLAYDQTGALTITATVTDPLARRCNAFSVGATVRDYSLVDQDSPNFYALIKFAELTEISLTDTPANPNALVTSRRDVAPMTEFYNHAATAVEHISQIIKLLGDQQCRTSL